MEKEIKRLKGKELSEYLVNKLDELADNICQNEEELREFVNRWRNGFYTYSLNNTLLILAQRADATLLAGFRQWQKRGRQVKKGSKSLKILAPMIKKVVNEEGDEEIRVTGFIPVSIFDIKDTSGADVQVGCSDLISGDVDFNKVKKACPYQIHLKELGLSNGSTDGVSINIAPKDNEAAMCSTLIHEWAHCDLGHCNQPGILFETNNRSAHEIEAESVSFIVGSAIGIKNNKSRLYIGNWKGNKKELKGRGKKIIATAEKIIRTIGADSNE